MCNLKDVVGYLKKPKQGKDLRPFRGELMNVPEDYGDKVEQRNNHPELLAEEEHITPSSEVLR